MKRILDVSNVNPADITTVRASRAAALICKATEGLTFNDHVYPLARQTARRLGIPFGGYLFYRPSVDALAQADHFLNYAKPRRGDLEPIIDTETSDGMGWAGVANNVTIISERLERAGFRPILYGSTDWLLHLYNVRPRLIQLRVWQAQYPSWLPPYPAVLRQRTKLGHGVTVVMWQYTSKWPILGRRYDGSYLLAPLNHLLVK